MVPGVFMSLTRLLIKHTYLSALLLIALASPAAALAAGGEDFGSSAPSVSDAQVAALAPLRQPTIRFRQVVHDVVHRILIEQRRELRERRERFADLPGGVSIETLEAIAACESGGDPAVVSSDGSYRGKYQFDYGTWESVGGNGDPAAAPEEEQDYRAALLYSRSGSSPWPVCG
jgi:TolA-binding protein